jgi:hypothetical protein
MWPSSAEYYNSIRTANYKPFEESDRNSKKYIDLSVGFYGGCSYHPSGWDATFASIRKHFPTEPIVLFEDGQQCGIDYSDMAIKYNATYVKEIDGVYLFWITPKQCWTYLQWVLQAADICKTEWLVQLHPDNICNDRFSTYPPGPLCGVGCGTRSGVSGNQLSPVMIKYLKETRPDLEMNGYGWCGGGCIHVPTFRKIMETFTYEKMENVLKTFFHNYPLHEDNFMPFLFNMYGYPYRVWLDIEETNRGTYGVSSAFQHGNKSFYNLTKEQIDNLGYTIQADVVREKLHK